MRRRNFLKTAGAGALGLTTAGCLQIEDAENAGGGAPATAANETGTTTMGGTTSGTPDALTIATYSSFFGHDGTAGRWLKRQWEAERDVEIEFFEPNAGVNEFILRKRQGAGIDADLLVGLNTGELVHIDQELGEKSLFDDMTDELEHDTHILDRLRVDPKDRALPYDTGYISLVYDGTDVDNPGTFEALTEPAYEGTLLAENAQISDTGRAFLLWTINQYGEDGYLDYWRELLANDVRVLSDWSATYDAFLAGERPIVVSYSTDQVYYHGENELPHHQVGFLNDEGYAAPETVARFAEAGRPEAAAEFVDFMLSKRAQPKIAVKNVQFPSTDWAELPPEYARYAYEPPNPVTFSYQDLAGNVEGWVEAWAREVAAN